MVSSIPLAERHLLRRDAGDDPPGLLDDRS